MRVLVVSHYFPPEIGAPQARLSELAAAWAAAGVEVEVLTGMPNHPTGVVPPEYRRRIVAEEQRDGYRVLRTWLFATPNEGLLKKTLGHLSFMVSSVVLGLPRTKKPDVVVVSSPTFFSIFSALLIARVRRSRFVVEVRDLWPAIFVELGVLTNRRLIGLLGRVELAMYAAADAVVVVSEGFRADLVRRGVEAEKVHVIRNGVDVELFGSPVDEADRQAERDACGAANDDVLVLYAGAHGISHGLSAVVKVASLVEDDRIRFALVGEGAMKRELQEQAAALGVTNLVFRSGVPREQMPALLAAADICLVPLRDVPLFRTFIPSKMFEYLAARRPVVAAVRGEAAAILEDAGAVVVPPEDADAIAAAVRDLAASPGRRATMATSGRAAVERDHDRRVLAARYLSILRAVARVAPPIDDDLAA